LHQGIKTGAWLIQNDKFRIMLQSAYDAYFTSVAKRQVADAPIFIDFKAAKQPKRSSATIPSA
jgi:hypothetical protein